MKSPARATFSKLISAARRLRKHPHPRPSITFRCPQAWEDMTPVDGAAGVRHCDRCAQNVYDLVGKSDHDIRAAIQASNGDLCGMVMVRQDGRVVAGECHGEEQQILRGRIAYREP